ncbi:hypothetical protein ISCGN_008348 [Ixodes scapularis]
MGTCCLIMAFIAKHCSHICESCSALWNGGQYLSFRKALQDRSGSTFECRRAYGMLQQTNHSPREKERKLHASVCSLPVFSALLCTLLVCCDSQASAGYISLVCLRVQLCEVVIETTKKYRPPFFSSS